MELNDICTLIKKEYVQEELKEVTKTTEKQVFCKVKSVTQNEFNKARTNGFKAEKTIIVAKEEYKEQQEVRINYMNYKVYRTYIIDENFTQLYLERF